LSINDNIIYKPRSITCNRKLMHGWKPL